MKFWKKKVKSSSNNNPFEEDIDSESISVAHSQSTTVTEPPKQRDVNQDRQSLFSGFMDRKKPQPPTNVYEEEEEQEQDSDQEIVQIKRKIRDVKQESLASTRNALQRINETEASAATTMNLLGAQSSQLANVERSLDLSKAYSDRASNQAGELQKLNRSIFIPNISNPLTRSSRDKEKVDRLNREHAQHITERNGIRQSEFDSSARIEETHRAVAMGKATNVSHSTSRRSQSDRSRYQFEADEQDDIIEDEINTNLDLLSDATSRLKMMASTMNEELDSQNKRLNKINKKVDPINAKLMQTTHRLNSTR